MKKIKAYGERALPTKVQAHNESEKIVALVRETFAETGESSCRWGRRASTAGTASLS